MQCKTESYFPIQHEPRTFDSISGKCPGCGGPAYIEEFDTYRPGEPARTKRMFRCQRIPKKDACLPQFEIIEKEPSTMPLAPKELVERYQRLPQDGVSRGRLAKLSGRPRSTVAGVLSGKNQASQESIDDLERALTTVEAEIEDERNAPEIPWPADPEESSPEITGPPPGWKPGWNAEEAAERAQATDIAEAINTCYDPTLKAEAFLLAAEATEDTELEVRRILEDSNIELAAERDEMKAKWAEMAKPKAIIDIIQVGRSARDRVEAVSRAFSHLPTEHWDIAIELARLDADRRKFLARIEAMDSFDGSF